MVGEREQIEQDLRTQSKELLSATQETVELSIKAADKAEAAADNADGIRADHDDFIERHATELEVRDERVRAIEERESQERARRGRFDKELRAEIDQVIERLAQVEQAGKRPDGEDDVIDLTDAAAPRGWQFERRARWEQPASEQS